MCYPLLVVTALIADSVLPYIISNIVFPSSPWIPFFFCVFQSPLYCLLLSWCSMASSIISTHTQTTPDEDNNDPQSTTLPLTHQPPSPNTPLESHGTPVLNQFVASAAFRRGDLIQQTDNIPPPPEVYKELGNLPPCLLGKLLLLVPESLLEWVQMKYENLQYSDILSPGKPLWHLLRYRR